LITDFYIVFQPSSHSHLNRASSLHQTGRESRLKALVDERDTLMNTGTYSLEDPIINKLDNEIKTLLANGITWKHKNQKLIVFGGYGRKFVDGF